MKFFLIVFAVVLLLISIAGCNDRDRVLGGAAIGAVAGAVIMDSANDSHWEEYHYRRPPPPYYQRYRHNRYRDGYRRYRRNDCGYDQYGNPYPCRRY